MQFGNSSAVGLGALLGLFLAGCGGSSSAPLATASASAATPAATTSLPAAPAAVTLKSNMEVECPAGSKPVADTWVGYGRVCHGSIPTYFAQAMVRIPQPDSSPEAKETWVSEDQDFTVIPGRGQRPDIMVRRDGPWIRSFEGSDPATTIYLVRGPYCDEPEDPDLGCGAFSDLRAYGVSAGGAPQDITAQMLLRSPLPTAADRKRYLEDHGATAMVRDDTRLTLVPTMRAIIELDPDRPLPPSDPRSIGYVHQGFLVWNGVGFELRDTVPRSLWPCEQVGPDKAPCANDVGDRFVTVDR